MTATRHYQHAHQHHHHHQHHQHLLGHGPCSSAWRRALQGLRGSLAWPQRKLFLLVFLWTCVCLIVFKTSLLSSGALESGPGPAGDDLGEPRVSSGSAANHLHLAARSAASLRPALVASNSLQFPQQQQHEGLRLASSPTTFEILAPEFDLPTPNAAGGPARLPVNHQLERLQYQTLASPAGQQDSDEPAASRASHSANVISSSSSSPVSSPQEPKPTAATGGGGGGGKRAGATRDKKKGAHLSEARQQDNNPGDSCPYQYPSLYDLKFNNIHWQKFVSQANGEQPQVANASSSSTRGPQEAAVTTTTTTTAQQVAGRRETTFYLYNAYYDDRWRGGLPSVRVLAMIDRIHPPPTNCLLWSKKLGTSESRAAHQHHSASGAPLVTRAQFVYAWYPKWGNYEEGLLQPWVVTCPVPREHVGLVPESVSLVDVPAEVSVEADQELELGSSSSSSTPAERLKKRNSNHDELAQLDLLPPSFSSSSTSGGVAPARAAANSSSSSPLPVEANHHLHQQQVGATSPFAQEKSATAGPSKVFDCSSIGKTITNNLPVFNRRPHKREKFAVCVKGLDFPYDGPEQHVSVRLVEWIEMLNLLGAKKIFLYELNVHANISKVLNYYEERGLVERSPLTLPGNQPNSPEYQHLYLKQKLTSKRQNELIPYNDCLYRNLYSYEYLALLDIDEIIMPLKRGHTNWYDLMGEVERLSLNEQNYSRASYNVRNVYFFDDLSGPLGTTQANTQPLVASSSSTSADSPDDDDPSPARPQGGGDGEPSKHRESAERGIPHYLHMMSHVYRSKNYTEPGQYVKCFHNTERVVSLHNHFPMNCFGQCTTYSIPVDLAHLQHYRKDCVGPLRQSCKNDFRLFTTRDTTIWRYKQRMIKRTTRVLNTLKLLAGPGANR